jgi:hypothetical protein
VPVRSRLAVPPIFLGHQSVCRDHIKLAARTILFCPLLAFLVSSPLLFCQFALKATIGRPRAKNRRGQIPRAGMDNIRPTFARAHRFVATDRIDFFLFYFFNHYFRNEPDEIFFLLNLVFLVTSIHLTRFMKETRQFICRDSRNWHVFGRHADRDDGISYQSRQLDRRDSIP